MSVFKPFEIKAVTLLVSEHISEDELSVVFGHGTLTSYEYTASGYYLTVRHPSLPSDQVVCNEPSLLGTSGDVQCGFVVFLGNEDLTLECHTWGPIEVPSDFREREGEIKVAA